MKYIYIFYLTVLAAMSSCSCGCSNDINFTYPKSFEPVTVDRNTIFLYLPDFMGPYVFDTKSKKCIYKYDFTGYSFVSNIEQFSDYIFIMLNEDDVDRQVTVSKLIQITISTGKVKEIPFYDDMPSTIEVIDNKLWIDSAYTDMYPRKIQIYDPATGEYNYMSIPHRFTGQPGGRVEGVFYTSVAASEHAPILDCSTGDTIDTIGIFGDTLSSFRQTYPIFCRDLGNSNSAYLGFLSHHATDESKNKYPLFKVDSLSNKEFTLLMNGLTSETGSYRYALEYNDYIYVFSVGMTLGAPCRLFKFDTTNYELVYKMDVPDIASYMKFIDNTFWFEKSDLKNVYSIDIETLTITEHKVDF